MEKEKPTPKVLSGQFLTVTQFFLIVAAVFVAAGAALVLISRPALKNLFLERERVAIADDITLHSGDIKAEDFLSRGDGRAEEVFGKFYSNIKTREVVRFKVWDKDGRIIFSDDKSLEGQTFPDNEEVRRALGGEMIAAVESPVEAENVAETGYEQLLEVYAPAILPGELSPVGVFEVYFKLDVINGYIREAQLLLLVAIGFSAAASFGLILLFFREFIYKPLAELRLAVSSIEGGDFSWQVNLKSTDQIGRLMAAFNDMAMKLKEYRAGLEGKVREKTADLAAKVKELEEARGATQEAFIGLELAKAKAERDGAMDEAILFSIGDGLVVTDRDGGITMVNKAFENLLGFSQGELVGKHIDETIRVENERGELVPPAKRAYSRALIGEMFRTDITAGIYYVRKDGTRFPASVSAAPIVAAGTIFGAVEVFRNISREKEIDRAKSDFIATASHQLRTPLVGIQWVVERLTKKEKLTKAGKEYISDIHLSATRLSKLVDLLLNVSRIESGISIFPKEADVVEIVTDCVAEHAPIISKKKLTVKFDERPAQLTAVTDRSTLRTILDAIVSNAVEYTPEGGGIDVALAAREGGFLIKVRDTGIGIPKAEQAGIFKKFNRASNAKLVRTDGTGLGLYIAAEATRLLGGKIWFESSENEGSTFFVDMPLKSEAVTGARTFA